MPVLTNSGGGLGQALLGGADAFIGARRQKRQDDLFEEQLANAKYAAATQRAQDEENGLHILAPGELPPPDVARNMVDYAGAKANAATPDNVINSSLTFSPQGGSPTLSRAGAGKANIPGQSGSFMDRMTSMLGQQPDRGAQYQVGRGYYIDKAPQWQAADAARSAKMSDAFESSLMNQFVAQGERDRKIRGYVAAGVDPTRAALYADNPALADNDPKIGKYRAPTAPVMGSPEWLKAQEDAAKIRAQYAPKDRVLVQTMGPNGPVLTPRDQAAGMAPVVGSGGVGGIGGMGSGGIGGLARTSSAITGMGVAHDQMVPYENAIAKGTASYDGLDYFKGLYSKMYGAEGVVDKAAHAAAFAQLDKQNPQLANYLRSAETWALEDSQLSGKASDFRTKMDNFVSEIGPNFSPDLIANTQRFRQTRLDELRKFQPAMQSMADRFTAGRGGAAASTKPPGDKGGDIDLRTDTTSSNPFMSLPKRKP